MDNHHAPIWPGGTYKGVTPSLDPSLIELAVQSSGQSIRRVCASHLHRLHSNLSQDQLLELICQDCPARHLLANQAQQLAGAGEGADLTAAEPSFRPGATATAPHTQVA